ncbi:MAG: DUF58 domain-containing protein [Planctomycetes bacterium]|nr:DUF58 domain-containing protein [Planctomycetota bacterium]
MKPSAKADIFSAEFIRKLERLRFVIRKSFFSGTIGERMMKQKGGRIEFAGHREYSPGDETRYLDWNAFARLGKLYVKEFSREQTLPLYLMLDISNSMSGPDAPKQMSKLDYCCQLAAALGYVGLVASQPVRLWAFNQSNFVASKQMHSDKQLFEMLTYLKELKASGQTSLSDALGRLDRAVTHKGFVIILSDLFEAEPESSRKILQRLSKKGFIINVMHISAGADELPGVNGLVRLHDSESAEEQTVWLDEKTIEIYRQTFLGFSEDWNQFCLKHDMKYFYLDTIVPIEDVIFRMLRKRELLK